jgi:hypothetical protein
MRLELHLIFKSDATFGRGDGVAGLVDEEIEHDSATGLPFLRGRTLKGLLAEECANLLFALGKKNLLTRERLEKAAMPLFGQAGSTLDDDALMHVGAAVLPRQLRDAVGTDIKRGDLTPADVLEALTAIRRQTAVDEETGAPDEGSLRSMRVLLRETPFVAKLDFDRDPQPDELALLTACVMSLRRGGTGRNRGRGQLRAWLVNEKFTADNFANFRTIVKGEAQ